MKKIIALLLALMMCLGLAACGQPSGDNSQTPATDPGTDATEPADPDTSEPAGDGEKPSVGFVTFMTSGEFFQSLADTYVTTMEAEGWDAYYVDARPTPASRWRPLRTTSPWAWTCWSSGPFPPSP